jgi:UDP-N-acetylmuramoylalanine-D-glutamate ligase
MAAQYITHLVPHYLSKQPPSSLNSLKNLFFLGLARSGLTSCDYLKKHHSIDAWGWDDLPSGREKGEQAGIKIQDCQIPWKTMNALVISPGIPVYGPKKHFLVDQAQAYNVPVLSDLELFRLLYKDVPVIAVTGSNGKSTVVALVHQTLRELGILSQEAGNNGIPVFSVLSTLQQEFQEGGKKGSHSFQDFLQKIVFVLEVSSFQLEITPSLKPDIAVLTGVLPDHLDRHGTWENYCQAKFSIFNQAKEKILGITNETTQNFYKEQQTRHKDAQYVAVGSQGDLILEQEGLFLRTASILEAPATPFKESCELDIDKGPLKKPQEKAFFIAPEEGCSEGKVFPWPKTSFGSSLYNRENMGLALGAISLLFKHYGISGKETDGLMGLKGVFKHSSRAKQGQKTSLDKEGFSLCFTKEQISQVFQSFCQFKGLPHRQESIQENTYYCRGYRTVLNQMGQEEKNSFSQILGKTLYVNDSKATNFPAAALALERFKEKKIFWILGGIPKSSDLKEVEDFLPSVTQAFLIGRAQEVYYEQFKCLGVHTHCCGTLDRAILMASKEVQRVMEDQKHLLLKFYREQQQLLELGPVFYGVERKSSSLKKKDQKLIFRTEPSTGAVLGADLRPNFFQDPSKVNLEHFKIEKTVILLSPGCSSLDQFQNFEARGNTFQKIVQGISCSDDPEEISSLTPQTSYLPDNPLELFRTQEKRSVPST